VPAGEREPVDVTVTLTPLGDEKTKRVSGTPDTVILTATRGAEWLQRVIVELRPDRVNVVVAPGDPHTPINRLTVRPDGSATFST